MTLPLLRYVQSGGCHHVLLCSTSLCLDKMHGFFAYKRPIQIAWSVLVTIPARLSPSTPPTSAIVIFQPAHLRLQNLAHSEAKQGIVEHGNRRNDLPESPHATTLWVEKP